MLVILHKMTKTGQAMFRLIGLRQAQKYGQSHTKKQTVKATYLLCLCSPWKGQHWTTTPKTGHLK